MMSPIEAFLTDFSTLAGAGIASWPALQDTAFDDDEPPAVADEDPLALAIAEAHQAGAAEATEAADARQAASEASLKDAYDQQRAADRQLWVETESALLAQLMAERLDALETRISDAAAVVLGWLLSETAGQKALAELRTAVQSLLIGDRERPILITGSADLIEGLRPAFASTKAVTFEPGDATDVVIQTGDTRIQTTLASWAERLALELRVER